MAEQFSHKEKVVSSNLTAPTYNSTGKTKLAMSIYFWVLWKSILQSKGQEAADKFKKIILDEYHEVYDE